jgi:hypothetical protein
MRKILMMSLLAFTSPQVLGANLDTSVFEATCLTSGKDCLYTALQAKSVQDVRARSIRYLQSRSRDDLADLFSVANHPKEKMYIMTSAALHGDRHWEYLKDKAAVTQAASSMGAKDTVVVKLDWLETVSAPENSVIAFQEDFRNHPNEMRTILFGGTKGAPLYAEWVVDNHHYYWDTSSTPAGVGPVVEMSGWKKDYDGSFYIVTTMASWKVFAHDYMAQSLKMERDAKFPAFQGNDKQKVASAVEWMAAHFKWSGIYGGGTFPDQPLSETIRRGAGDCKALDLVFRSILSHSGIEAHPSMLSASGMPPLSYILPDAGWGDHVVTYIPAIDKYVDINLAIKDPGGWQSSAQGAVGATTLDLSTGHFAVIGVTRDL